jgi:hypothetical protein
MVAVAGLLFGVAPKVARAAAPMTADEAQATAQHYREQAARYETIGGPAYKSGAVQRAKADAAEYSALADELAAPPTAQPVRSPEAEHYAMLVARYRTIGGPVYKSGYVQWLEAQQRAEEGAPPFTAPTYQQTGVVGPWCRVSKPTVRTIACSR